MRTMRPKVHKAKLPKIGAPKGGPHKPRGMSTSVPPKPKMSDILERLFR